MHVGEPFENKRAFLNKKITFMTPWAFVVENAVGLASFFHHHEAKLSDRSQPSGDTNHLHDTPFEIKNLEPQCLTLIN
jgi:hypothetical protein